MFENSPYSHALNDADEKKLMGMHHEAIGICEEILCDDLECNEALEEIGDNYLSLRDFPEAINALKQAKKVNPKSANAHYLLGFAYSGINEWKESIYELEIADSLEPNHPEILRCLGWSVYHYGEKEKGIVLLQRAVMMTILPISRLITISVIVPMLFMMKKTSINMPMVMKKRPSNIPLKGLMSASI